MKPHWIDRHEEGDLIVSTVHPPEAHRLAETAISHPEYDNGKWIIVQEYDDLGQARAGHLKWVEIMSSPDLPDELHDVSSIAISVLIDVLSPDRIDRRLHRRSVAAGLERTKAVSDS